MQATVLPTRNAPEISALGEVLHRGWLNLKIRSMVNMRPRHARYCVLTKDKGTLSTFKFQPSSGELQSNTLKPVRVYKLLGVTAWDGRPFAFLASVTQQDEHVDRMLEIDARNHAEAQEWLHCLRLVVPDYSATAGRASDGGAPTEVTAASAVASAPSSSPTPSTSANLSRSLSESDADDLQMTKQPDMWVKGASVHRGLLNASGENNCFLNVIIQSFWHLTSMRQYLLHVEIKDESRSVESNVLRALKSIMTLYDDTSSGLIHSRGLRKGLSVLYAADKNFQEGAMYDAEETLLALLNLMHQQTLVTEVKETQKTSAIVKSLVRSVSTDASEGSGSIVFDEHTVDDDMYEESRSAVFDENSIPHLVFSHQIYDRYVCDSCHHFSKWRLYSNLVFTTYAHDICAKPYESTEHMLKEISSEHRDIPDACDQEACAGKTCKQRTIQRFPMVFAVSVLWGTNSATKDQISTMLDNIDDRVDLAKCFNADGPVAKLKHGGLRTTYRLRGFVCYYGQHYMAVFYSTAHKAWLLFDDNRVVELGAWEAVASEFLKGRFQIVLMFYELPDQRKDSSVSIFMLQELMGSSTSLLGNRRKSSSMSSNQGDLSAMTIQESPDEDLQSVHHLSIVNEDAVSSSSHSSNTETATSSSTSPTAVGTDPVAPLIVDVPVNREFELAQLGHLGVSAQDIVPVSSAIAMCPRTIAMTAPCAPNEYDVRFSDDAVVLGMYLEKVDSDLCVTKFPRGMQDEMFGAEQCGHIGVFDLVLQANGHPLQHYPVDRALKMIKAQTRPLVIRFRRSPRVQQLVEMGVPIEKAREALSVKRGNVQSAALYCFETNRKASV